jgi:plasmid stabilization system protein ParE
MNFPIELGKIADIEFKTAVGWYNQKRAGLGLTFISAVFKRFQKITDNPYGSPIVYADVREAIVPRWPFAIYYRILESKISVVAIFHTSRDPEAWQERL